MAYEVILYRTKSGNCPIEKHIHRLRTENKKSEVNRILHYAKYLETYGFEMSRYVRNSIKQIKGSNPKIFELRPGNNRIFFFFCVMTERLYYSMLSKKNAKNALSRD